MNVCTPTRSASDVVRGLKPGLPACATVDAVRSMPAQNASPSPVISTARTSGSARNSRIASMMPSRMPIVSAFFASGRSSTIRPTPSMSRSTRRSVWVMTVRPVGEDVDDRDARAAPARVVLQRVAVAGLDLAFAGLAAQLPPALGDLRDAGRADRMALGEQPAARVDRDATGRARSRLRGSRDRRRPCRRSRGLRCRGSR